MEPWRQDGRGNSVVVPTSRQKVLRAKVSSCWRRSASPGSHQIRQPTGAVAATGDGIFVTDDRGGTVSKFVLSR